MWDERIKGRVFNIQHFSIHDGPGIRSTVFFMGCPLNCLWCHNPEGRGTAPFIGFDVSKCMRCGACAETCPHGCHIMREGTHVFHREDCQACSRCTDACAYDALYWVGASKSVDEVASEVAKDKPYFDKSGGGVTLSGGEPLMQPAFCCALVRALRDRDISTAVETCGYGPRATFEALLPYTDLFLYDCKETDPVLHKRYTGLDKEPILENLFFLHEKGAKILLRCPIIPGLNDRDTHFQGISHLAAQLPGILGVEVLAYHSLGAGKTRRMGLPPQEQFPVPGKDAVAQWNKRLEDLGCKVMRR